MDMTQLMEKVNMRADARRKYQRDKALELYRYAKAKGFTASQASVLSFKSKQVIDELVKEKLAAGRG